MNRWLPRELKRKPLADKNYLLLDDSVRFFSTVIYIAGKTKRVNRVDVANPNITVTARGRWTSAPGLFESIRGSSPSRVVRVVIITGLNRIKLPFITASRTLCPSFLRTIKSLSITIESCIAIPKRAINPIDAGTDRY